MPSLLLAVLVAVTAVFIMSLSAWLRPRQEPAEDRRGGVNGRVASNKNREAAKNVEKLRKYFDLAKVQPAASRPHARLADSEPAAWRWLLFLDCVTPQSYPTPSCSMLGTSTLPAFGMPSRSLPHASVPKVWWCFSFSLSILIQFRSKQQRMKGAQQNTGI